MKGVTFFRITVDHALKGYEGHIVGSRLVNPYIIDNPNGSDDQSTEDTEDAAILEFEVNKLNHITTRHLQEKYSSKLPIMEAIHLPPHLRRPKATGTVPDTQLPMAMTPCDGDSTWEGATHEYTSDLDITFAAHDRFTRHWLRNPVMMHKKFQILILDTLFDDSSYRTDNAVSGYMVVMEAVDRWAERVFVKMGEQRNLSTKKILLKKIIPDNLFLRQGERVIVIGADVVGNDQIIGMAGWVNESPYSLDEDVQFVALAEPPGFVFARLPLVSSLRTPSFCSPVVPVPPSPNTLHPSIDNNNNDTTRTSLVYLCCLCACAQLPEGYHQAACGTMFKATARCDIDFVGAKHVGVAFLPAHTYPPTIRKDRCESSRVQHEDTGLPSALSARERGRGGRNSNYPYMTYHNEYINLSYPLSTALNKWKKAPATRYIPIDVALIARRRSTFLNLSPPTLA
ncbi:hypothetical protein BDN71DRAFT_1434665 [Pleurotus eryngii]|uniref:Uncharacterized protein n=1 Tax=Pleurotus eryngii TaxID=5323 RepID=A0A9P5ZN26_PLEER|nr:hypothetical protein BDN71DRAFT_1434665 [Pleurotus eryngii]